MTRPRYLWVAAPQASVLAAIAEEIGRFRPDLVRHEMDEQTALWAEPQVRPIQVGRTGLLIGDLFETGQRHPLRAFPPAMAETAQAAATYLIRGCWGGYVAFWHGPPERAVLRAPLGDLPCLVARIGRALLAASDVAMLSVAGLPPPSIDWQQLAGHLMVGDIKTETTCLAGIADLPGGSALRLVDDTEVRERRWSPWQFAAADRQLFDRDEAVRRLRGTILTSVRLHAADRGRLILKLSGGLDSSIVAAALADAGADFDCLNLVTSDGTGDERRYARLAAAAIDRVPVEMDRQLAKIDLTRSAAAALPRPQARAFTQASDAAVEAVAAQTGAMAVFDGGGGDNVFCALQSVRPVIDCMRDWRGRELQRATVRSVAALAQVSAWEVTRKAWLARLRRSVRYPWARNLSLLHPDAAAGGAAVTHPWFDPPNGALPGKAAHVALITQAQSVAEGMNPTACLPLYSPLLSQPIVETCLKIPSWLWFDGPHNRAIARAAFAGVLPDEVMWRPSKGSPDAFIAALYENRREQIRDMLNEGLLAANGLIHLTAVNAMLDDPRPVVGHAHLRLLQFIDAEAWARAWA